MIDRQSENPFRFKLTHDDGTVEFVTLERADNPTVIGTPLNKNTLFNSNNSERYAAELPSEAFGLLTRDIVVTVPASEWSTAVDSEGWHTNQVFVEGMNGNHSPSVSLVYTSTSTVDDEQAAFGTIKEIETFNGYIVCKCVDTPEIDVVIKLSGV